MSKYRHRLPQLRNALFLTDGGLETTLVFHEQVELPYFAAFTLLKTRQGIERLRRYFETYTRIALEHGVGIVLEAPTWRANPDWAAKLGYDAPRWPMPTGWASACCSKCASSWRRRPRPSSSAATSARAAMDIVPMRA